MMTDFDSRPAIVLSGVRFRYHDSASWALDGIDLTIRRGEYVCVVGANGSGKSTMALIMAGLTAPDEGTVDLLGHRVFDAAGAHPDAYREARHGIGMVFQNPEDQIVTTVLADDVAFGPENLGVSRDGIARSVDAALDAVEMADRAGDDPTRMSEGQQQRTAIAGMLAMDPQLLILDEPTAMLDTAARADILRILDALHNRGTTIVHITHSASEAARGERVIEIAGGHVVGDRAMAPATAQATTQRTTSHRTTGDTQPDATPGDATATPMPQAIPAPAASAAASPVSSPAPASHEPPAIKMRGVSFAYSPDARVLDGLNLTVARGESVALVGRNGAGKSTIARLVCALAKPQSGQILVGGIDVTRAKRKDRRELRRHVGYVMQHPERQLFADTVRQDVAYGPRNQGLSDEEVNARVDEALGMLGIAHLADRSPFDLSGGQQRLAAIAGVIACRPDILIMDEPTASLDARATTRIRDLIRTLHDRGVTILLITHAPEELELADRVVDLSPRKDVPNHPAASQSRPSAQRNPSAQPRRSDAISRMDPRVKMTLTLLLMFSAFAMGNLAQLAAGAALLAVTIAAARINPLRLVAKVHPFLALFAITGLANIFFVHTGTPVWQWGSLTITDAGLWTALIYVLRFALVILLGAVFLETTTPTSMTDAFESLLSPLARLGAHTHELSLVMSLALRFIPTLTGETRSIVDAQAARGGSIETGSLMQRARAMGAIAVPVFAGTLRHADNLSRALDARCYEGGSGRTHYRVMRIAGRDWVAMTLAAAYVAALVALGVLAH